jgi:hypothetical protein
MAKHFDLLNNFSYVLEHGQPTMQNPGYRLGLIEMFMKCGDVSNVARPFELADKWSDGVCEEFFKQGDLEAAEGMDYTSSLKDREHLDRQKSQIGFYEFICLPLFEAMAKALPVLDGNVTQVRSNLERWKQGGGLAAK